MPLEDLGVNQTGKHQRLFAVLIEVIMAKRRNMKKEKAERNKAYARKFHKSRTGKFSSRKGGGYNSSGRNQNDASSTKAED